MSRAGALTIVDVYPGAMFPQGDGGNLRMLEYRARTRGGSRSRPWARRSATRSRG